MLGDALRDRGQSLDQLEGNVIRDVWYGRRLLPEIFWFWGGLIGGVGSALLGLFAGFVAGTMRSPVPLYLFLVLMLPYRVWITVGLWRSAGNDSGIWPILVRILVVIGVVYTPFQLVALFQNLPF
jgi:hypothetical protein